MPREMRKRVESRTLSPDPKLRGTRYREDELIHTRLAGSAICQIQPNPASQRRRQVTKR